MHKIGKTFIVSGPSGVGKSTVLHALFQGRDDLYFSVSATTRAPREGEQDGVDYHFIQADAFRDMIAADAFLEYAEYVGNFYGTPKMYVDDAMARGKDVILDIERQGAVQVCAKRPETVRIFISIGSQSLRSLLAEAPMQALRGKTVVLCMKGLEMGTGERLSVIAGSLLHESNTVAVWLGPGHVQEFYRGIPNCMVIDSGNDAVKRRLVQEFSSDLIRFYYGGDMIGNEVGAAAKNVVGIAAGFLDGVEMSSLKGALMSRGTREVARLIKAMGGNELSAYGLCHLGDYEATVFSPYSHNRQFGESFIRHQDYHRLAEGYYTVEALMVLREKHGVELPICMAVHNILYESADPRAELSALLRRGLRAEFDD